MAKVILGNHTALIAPRSEQDRIRKHTALDESAFLKAIYLELKTDSVEEMKQRILAFGVKKIDVPDPHLYFQAPGGQAFRLVGINEDLSLYEESPSSRPGSSR
jgi:hypothetical protein